MPVSVRKVRSVTRLLKGMRVEQAQAVLAHLAKGACKPVSKVLDSAVANATREGTWSREQLVISKILADQGPGIKRFRAAAMGRGTQYRKGLCHLTIELDVKKNGT
ncbi:MAG: 50S ribosomal protein L22 [Candidatus Omnitrophica bacterium]|nr:50S ribosomal protein L22 [Candidatus Omnitrophota bacterium]